MEKQSDHKLILDFFMDSGLPKEVAENLAEAYSSKEPPPDPLLSVLGFISEEVDDYEA